ncbi:MAG TPA: SRPBCC family protein [Acidimicrobiales bacterium]
MNTDRIEREIAIEAPIERVWAALTQPASVSAWFCNGEAVTIDLRVGGVMTLDIGEHGYFKTAIVTLDPPNVFSYRWASAYPGELATEENSTLVEFSLTSTLEGTLLRVVESGFDSLDIPEDRVAHAGYENHSQGWPSVIGELAKYVVANKEIPLVDSQ